MGNLAVTYAQRPDATPEGELAALANIYRIVLCQAHRNAPGVSKTSATRLRNAEEVGNVERRPR